MITNVWPFVIGELMLILGLGGAIGVIASNALYGWGSTGVGYRHWRWYIPLGVLAGVVGVVLMASSS